MFILLTVYGAIKLTYTHTLKFCPPGCCDGNPEDDLKLPNGTVVREVGDMMVFLQAWRVQTTDETEHTRRVGDNCTTGDCSTCLSMLRQRAFTSCHSKVAVVFTKMYSITSLNIRQVFGYFAVISMQQQLIVNLLIDTKNR